MDHRKNDDRRWGKRVRSISTWILPVGLALAVFLAAVADQDPAPCSSTISPGESIQAAIDAAADGAVLCLEPGTYEENLTITHAVTLRGLGETLGEVEIKGASKYDPGVVILNPEGNAEPFTVAFENLTLSNRAPMKRHGIEVKGTATVTLRGVAVVGSEAYALILRDESRAEVVSSWIAETKSGVGFNDASQGLFVDSTLTDSQLKVGYTAVATFEGCDLSGSGFTVSGSAVMQAADTTFDRCRYPQIASNAQATFANCSFWQLEGAIYVMGSAHLRLEDCTLTEGYGGESSHCTGLEVMDTASAEVVRCTFADNEEIAIQLRGSATLHLEDSQILRSGELGLMTLCVDCASRVWSASTVSDYYPESEEFVGQVTGSGNIIPGPGAPDANVLGGVCPESLRFLTGS